MKIYLDVNQTLGSSFVLTKLSPIYEYKEENGKRIKTNTITGSRAECALMQRLLEKINVKLPNAPEAYQSILESNPQGAPVNFENLTGKAFVNNRNANFAFVEGSYSATDMKVEK